MKEVFPEFNEIMIKLWERPKSLNLMCFLKNAKILYKRIPTFSKCNMCKKSN